MELGVKFQVDHPRSRGQSPTEEKDAVDRDGDMSTYPEMVSLRHYKPKDFVLPILTAPAGVRAHLLYHLHLRYRLTFTTLKVHMRIPYRMYQFWQPDFPKPISNLPNNVLGPPTTTSARGKLEWYSIGHMSKRYRNSFAWTRGRVWTVSKQLRGGPTLKIQHGTKPEKVQPVVLLTETKWREVLYFISPLAPLVRGVFLASGSSACSATYDGERREVD
ncbi:hypothetical protein H0H93_011473 [Arthromyces matolae]|nr:hypothetical protein H0H93_011473 [Arthromyces matolae]